jgi:hypothetical protein
MVQNYHFETTDPTFVRTWPLFLIGNVHVTYNFISNHMSNTRNQGPTAGDTRGAASLAKQTIELV